MSQLRLNRIKVLLVFVQLYESHIKVILLIFNCFFLKYLGDEDGELFRLLCVLADLLLHVTAHALPLTQGKIMVEGELGY